MATAMGNMAIPSKGRRDTELKHTGSWSTKELPRSQTTFPRLFSALMHSKKKHFVTKNKNYKTTSELQTSPQGHTNDSRLTSARADTILSLKMVLSIAVTGCWLPKWTGSWSLSGGYKWASAPKMLLSHTNRYQHSSFSSLSCCLSHQNQSSGRR